MTGNRVLFGTDGSKTAQEKALDLQEIARVAYGLYEQRGREDGHALEDWVKAEAIVRDQKQRTNRSRI
jgi:hypothetical protein